ncbi:FAD/NAD(P)-binding domain-containing protein [Polychaeton citri CBS 116435]|uniref:FAD/NAD(P)-binding domain-containing protein n=1 Tax=Polychaeton citri CBS 116435 TaxID=1314669 RepID=A0A9P4QG44_9PEZI|nr:FAD/NAD(P)-binding domain-containing protein [Polychaeton citri CBS 116435]
MPFRIAIIGAGPAGCLLARLLQRGDRRISVDVYERDASANFRSQGGTLDLHVPTGQKALKEAGLYDAFLKYARFDGEALQVTDDKLLRYISIGGGDKKGSTNGRPEIDREKLQLILREGLEEGTVNWDSKLVRVDDDLTLHFADGRAESGFDLVVGADGAWSKARRVLSSDRPYHGGIGGYCLTIRDVEKRKPDLYKLVNRGSLFCFGQGKSIGAQYLGDGSLDIRTWFVQSEGWQERAEFDVSDATAVKSAIQRDFASWDSRLLDLVREAADTVRPVDLYMLPIGSKWEHKPKITLIGDAAHLMLPFAGEGANLALHDSMQLGKAILNAAREHTWDARGGEEPAHDQDIGYLLDRNVESFETEMFKLAETNQQVSYNMKNITFNSGPIRWNIERFILTAARDVIGPIGTILLTPLVYAYFFIFRLIW